MQRNLGIFRRLNLQRAERFGANFFRSSQSRLRHSSPLIPTMSRGGMLCAPSPHHAETVGRQESHLGSLTWTSSVCDIQTSIRPTSIKAERQKIVAGQLPRTAEQKRLLWIDCTLKVPMWRELEWCHFDSSQEAHQESYRTSAYQAQRAPVPYHGSPHQVHLSWLYWSSLLASPILKRRRKSTRREIETTLPKQIAIPISFPTIDPGERSNKSV